MITVFTPTYNRYGLLLNLKRSLDKQTDKDFEWIIVDDGSSDGTRELVNSWMNYSKYSIKYYLQKNSGKHIAYNKGVELAQGNIFICVDSDDWLLEDAIEKIKLSFIKMQQMKAIGIVYPRIDKFRRKYNNWNKIHSKLVDIIDLKEIYNIVESAIVIRTEILKTKVPFEKFRDEKFLPESWLYLDLCKDGKFLAQNDGFYVSEYQADGLTKNLWKHWKNNYYGVSAILKKKYIVTKKYGFILKEYTQFKVILNINALCMAADKNIFVVTPSKVKSILFFIPSWILYKIRYGDIGD